MIASNKWRCLKFSQHANVFFGVWRTDIETQGLAGLCWHYQGHQTYFLSFLYTQLSEISLSLLQLSECIWLSSGQCNMGRSDKLCLHPGVYRKSCMVLIFSTLPSARFMPPGQQEGRAMWLKQPGFLSHHLEDSHTHIHTRLCVG